MLARFHYRNGISSIEQRDQEIELANKSAKLPNNPVGVVTSNKADNTTHVRMRTKLVYTLEHPFPSEKLKDFMDDVHLEKKHYTAPHYDALKEVYPEFIKLLSKNTHEYPKTMDKRIHAFRA